MAEEGRKVLVVDDDPNIVGFVEMLLEAEGYSVITARNGKEALEAVSSHRPDVVLLDMVMPVMDGWEFSRQLRDAGLHDMPIIVMSASVDARKTSCQLGACGYLAKPFELDYLLKSIDSVLS